MYFFYTKYEFKTHKAALGKNKKMSLYSDIF